LFATRDKKKKSQKKYGFFQTEVGIFQEVASQLQLIQQGEAWSRHPLAFLVEAADDICYSVIDLEDGCRLGLVSFEETVELLAGILKSNFDRRKLDQIPGQDEKVGVLRALTIGKLIDECSNVFLDHEREILNGTFDKALTDLCESADGLNKISSISIDRIYHARHVVEIESAGYQVLPGLLEEFVNAGKEYTERKLSKKEENLIRLLPQEIKAGIDNEPGSLYSMLRNMIDFISGMTDRHAISLYRKIKGISLN